MAPFDELAPGADPERAALLAAYRGVDWDGTALGEPSTWPDALTSTLMLVLETRVASVLFWGPDHLYLCNDVLARTIGERLPSVLGRPAAEAFPESWPHVAPLVAEVLGSGGATWREDAAVPVQRDGYLEETFFSFSYSPVRGPDGEVLGVFGVSVDTTQQVRARHRLELLNALGECTRTATTVEELRDAAVRLLADRLPELRLDVVVETERPGGTLPHPVSTDPLAAAAAWRVEPVGPDADAAAPDAPPGAPVAGARGVVAWEPGPGGLVPPGAVPVADGAGASPQGRTFLLGRADARVVHDASLRRFLQVVADALHAGVVRIRSLDGERARAADDRATSLQLQAAMLEAASTDGAPPGARVATRYVPAAARAQVGGDWHDAFVLPDGPLVVAIGDVAGHDSRSAAAMGQLRSLVRGLALAHDRAGGTGPARTVELLDRAVAHFALDAVATLVVAEVERDADVPATGADEAPAYRFRWANAGHPPPLLLGPDGTAGLLDGGGELILGIDPDTPRHDLVATVTAGSTVLLYTDGLVERRGEPLDVGLERLRRVLAAQAGTAPDELCDAVLHELGPFHDDDVAVLALRLG